MTKAIRPSIIEPKDIVGRMATWLTRVRDTDGTPYGLRLLFADDDHLSIQCARLNGHAEIVSLTGEDHLSGAVIASAEAVYAARTPDLPSWVDGTISLRLVTTSGAEITAVWHLGAAAEDLLDEDMLELKLFQPRTHDYGPGKRRFGHDYAFTPTGEKGQLAKATGWGHGIANGDYLVIEQPKSKSGTTRYMVTSITYMSDPKDMWTAQLTFAPRWA